MIKKYAVPILMLVTMISLCVAAYFAFFYEVKEVVAPDFMPVEQDKNVDKIVMESDTSKMEKEEGGGAVTVICKDEAVLSLGSGKINMFYQNPSRSNSAVVVQLLIGETVIAQSGSIKPGYELSEMEFLNNIELSVGGYNGLLKIFYYDEVTNEKSIIESVVGAEIFVVP
ncbi:MAG: hypothetical protein J6C34_08170 [Oscillospiraceae bacterium]|nr:hypothetical protein [Oscillospiraceae bacterium]MBQ8595201.1 hypothetical protein [Oscillospiraceae bacterium]